MEFVRGSVMTGVRRVKLVAFAAGLMLAVGCMQGGLKHGAGHTGPGAAPGPQIAVPPPGAVPRELDLVTLPPYVIAPPDQLLIEVIRQSEVTENVGGKELKKTVAAGLPVQPISGPFQVRPDGSVGLGMWGAVPVSGLTLDQAAAAIRNHVIEQEPLKKLKASAESVIVIVDVMAYNSKRYYVIYDGGGWGEQVFPQPITGNETVLDALSNLNGLPDVASKRNIWVARRTPHCGQPWQILPVDWVGITQHGITTTNYQIMPGDRIYVKAQKLVTIDRTLARIFAPIERIFGVTLLGASTVNQISGRGNGFNDNN